MKINPFMTIVSFLFAALAGYALYAYCRTEELKWVITIAGGLSIFLTWACTLAVSVEDKRRTANMKVLSGISAVVITAMQVVFTFSSVSLTTYILVTGILLFVWLVCAYGIGHTSK